MRLRALLLSLSARGSDYTKYVDILEQAGLKTTDDLLFTSSSSQQHARLPHGAMSFLQFAALKEEVTRLVAVSAVTGDESYIDALNKESARYRGEAGVTELDALLNGFGQCGVIEIAGGKGTCKSLLAFHVLLRYLVSEPAGTALWIDTTNSFSADRALAVSQLLDGPGRATALDRLSVAVHFDIQTVISVLDDTRQDIDLNPERGSASSHRFIVIDAVAPLLKNHISSTSSQGHAIMQSFFRQLKSLARSYSMTILVINSTTLTKPRKELPAHETGVTKPPHNELSAFDATITKPSLGPTFTFLTDVTILLSEGKSVFPEDDKVTRPGSNKIYVAEVLRARNCLSGCWCAFKTNGINLLPG